MPDVSVDAEKDEFAVMDPRYSCERSPSAIGIIYWLIDVFVRVFLTFLFGRTVL